MSVPDARLSSNQHEEGRGQYELMLRRWKEQHPDVETERVLRIQARMIVDDVNGSQQAEVVKGHYYEAD